ncbi:hypothetical protein [Gluconobacter oxydans]|uniref:Uncharacterized protein n=1 Tax=Gluconobacter oxydans NBRC 3293 TaxID=1315969 RepID=A0A829X2V5_GLUOY|nr:hypothetical protein [Gluconobacter oxydans]GEM17177.1 hypothetical protein NBRC3293_1674 [Gluconobacter oxydans NBRC 3293]
MIFKGTLLADGKGGWVADRAMGTEAWTARDMLDQRFLHVRDPSP